MAQWIWRSCSQKKGKVHLLSLAYRNAFVMWLYVIITCFILIFVFWVVASHGLRGKYQHFGGTFSRRWRQHVNPKRLYLFANPDVVTTHNIDIFSSLETQDLITGSSLSYTLYWCYHSQAWKILGLIRYITCNFSSVEVFFYEML